MFFLNALLVTAVVTLPALAGWVTCRAVAESAAHATSVNDTDANTQKTLIWVSWVLWITSIFCHAMAWQVISVHRTSFLPAALIVIEISAFMLTGLGAALVDAEVRAEKRRLDSLKGEGEGEDADAS